MKKFFAFVICCVMLTVFSMSVFAFNDSTYSNLQPDSQAVLDLLNFASNFEDFIWSDYVLYQVSDSSYCLVWSDNLDFDGSYVSSEGVQYVSCVISESGSSYTYGTSDSFTLSVNHMTVSNIESLGFKSPLHSQYVFYDTFKYLGIFALAALLVIAVSSVRKVINK